jgi:hypothetical protein
MITSVPGSIPLTVTNPVDGIPSLTGEPISIFRERCFTAGLAASTGMARYLKTLCGNVLGVLNRLIAVQVQDNNYIVIVGGGDPYQVAYAIWQADFFTEGLSGATIKIENISNTNPVVVTTTANHNLSDGDIEVIAGVIGMMGINGIEYPITTYRTAFPSSPGPIPDRMFTIPVDGTQMGPYMQGGTVTPNPINTYISVADFPDSYIIPYVIPPQEKVFVQVVWRTDSPNFVSSDAIATAAIPEIVDYINSLPAGTTPINLNVLNKVFLDAVSSVLVGEYIIDLEWAISINGIPFSPQDGTQVIFGDPFSYFYTENGQVQVLKGPF